jgi:hypothetical protein
MTTTTLRGLQSGGRTSECFIGGQMSTSAVNKELRVRWRELSAKKSSPNLKAVRFLGRDLTEEQDNDLLSVTIRLRPERIEEVKEALTTQECQYMMYAQYQWVMHYYRTDCELVGVRFKFKLEKDAVWFKLRFHEFEEPF